MALEWIKIKSLRKSANTSIARQFSQYYFFLCAQFWTVWTPMNTSKLLFADNIFKCFHWRDFSLFVWIASLCSKYGNLHEMSAWKTADGSPHPTPISCIFRFDNFESISLGPCLGHGRWAYSNLWKRNSFSFFSSHNYYFTFFLKVLLVFPVMTVDQVCSIWN